MIVCTNARTYAIVTVPIALRAESTRVKEPIMEKKSSGVWKFLAILFGSLLAGGICYYFYQKQNPQYDPWEEPWENSSSPIDLGLDDDDDDSDELEDGSDEAEADKADTEDADAKE